jgi:hypothetical protein
MLPGTGEALGDALAAPQSTIAAEQRHGARVGHDPTGGDKYTRVRNPDGTSRWASPVEIATRIGRDANEGAGWADMIPTGLTPFRYVGPAADAATEGYINLTDQMARARAEPRKAPYLPALLNRVGEAAGNPVAGAMAGISSPAASLGRAVYNRLWR